MLIGVDLDNTIISYEASLQQLALELYPDVKFSNYAKDTVKSTLLSQPEGMNKWMRLQGKLYGYGLKWALPYAGATEFFRQMQTQGHQVVIVSHKTEHGHFDEDRINLHKAALKWLQQHLFSRLAREVDAHFCPTQDKKVNTIAALACDIFIDDLFEIFEHPGFPSKIKAIYFDENDSGSAEKKGRAYRCASWYVMRDILLDCA